MSDALRIAYGSFGRVALLDMDRSLVRHAHPHCHVLLKVDGDDTQFLVGDQIVPLTNDYAVLVNAWEPHAYVHDPGRCNAVLLALYIEPQWLRAFRSNWGASAAPGFFQRSSGEISGRMRRLVLDLAAEMVHRPGASRQMEELLSDLMISVVERFTPWLSIGTSPCERRPHKGVDWRVRKAINLMEQNPAARLEIAVLAHEAGMSRAHFFRTFEVSTGVTPHVFLNALRVERAVDAILASNDTLRTIGASLGFNAQAHFARFFRDHCSVSPGEFRSVARMGR